MARLTNSNRITALENDVLEIKNNLNEQNKKLDAILNSITASQPIPTSDKKSVSKSTKSPQTSQKKSEKQTWEQHLTATFGSKEVRTKFAKLRGKVSEEFSAIAEAEEVYIPKRMYKQVLNSTTESLNGKFNKAKIREAFLAVAK